MDVLFNVNIVNNAVFLCSFVLFFPLFVHCFAQSSILTTLVLVAIILHGHGPTIKKQKALGPQGVCERVKAVGSDDVLGILILNKKW